MCQKYALLPKPTITRDTFAIQTAPPPEKNNNKNSPSLPGWGGGGSMD